LERKEFLRYSALAVAAFATTGVKSGNQSISKSINKQGNPLAITMWDFSWLERRWPGGSYEDWDKALNELVDRGYNAVRIDAYPHLIAEDPYKEWTLLPCWDVQDWGSPGKIKVTVYPSLSEFIGKCKKRNIKVGLSTWYREDVDNVRMKITTPEKMAENWIKTLDLLEKENLLDTILYVDMCNEWLSFWSVAIKDDDHNWSLPTSMDWMKDTIELMKVKYPNLPYTFSLDYSGKDSGQKLKENPLPFFDLLEHHLWMATQNSGEFNKTVGYNWHRFSNESYLKLIENGENLYRSKPEYWQNLLVESIKSFASGAKSANLPIITTECWSIVDYKDYPMLNWNWIKDLCELGVTTAASTGQWVAIATSNFCGPQFVGMWQDVEWHKKMTKIIKSAPISDELKAKKIFSRLK
jgi:hypothetical protein